MTDQHQLVGEWKLVDSQNFEAFMKELGVSFMLRKLGNTTKPNVNFAVDAEGAWTFTTTSAIKTSKLNFKLGEEIDETRLDGAKCKTTFKVVDDSKLVQTQVDKDGNNVVYTREVLPNGEMKLVAQAGKVETVRTYQRDTK